jgi:RNA polymerase-binding transcription factor DksA
MDDVRNRLDRDLKTAISRLRHPGGAVALIEELPWTVRESCPFADEVDGIQANESREVGWATRELLMERVNRLSAALDRMSEGTYGTCVECGQAISAARLHAMPEVQTCVRCQDGIERVGGQTRRSGRSVFAASEDNAMAAASLASIRARYLLREDDRDVRVPGTLRAAASF